MAHDVSAHRGHLTATRPIFAEPTDWLAVGAVLALILGIGVALGTPTGGTSAASRTAVQQDWHGNVARSVPRL